MFVEAEESPSLHNVKAVTMPHHRCAASSFRDDLTNTMLASIGIVTMHQHGAATYVAEESLRYMFSMKPQKGLNVVHQTKVIVVVWCLHRMCNVR